MGHATEVTAVLTEARVPIAQLTTTLTPRLRRVDQGHARTLAMSYEQLPPILVHRETMAVIDGVHRLIAGRLLAHDQVPVRFFDGTEFDGFVEGVRANSTHGKPLTFEERKGAAGRILASRPDWSDRKVAELCGLSSKTVAAVRACSTGEGPQLSSRVGRDGKRRPNDPRLVRLRVAELFRRHPAASARAVAAQAQTSQATVLDVRRRLDRGENPLPERLRGDSRTPPPAGPELQSAMTDAALTATEQGVEFSQWFDRSQVSKQDAERYFEAVPRSRLYVVADEARSRSATWQWFATLVERRARHTGVG